MSARPPPSREEPNGTAEWHSGAITTPEAVEHMIAALRSMRAPPGVERLVLKDAAAMIYHLAAKAVAPAPSPSHEERARDVRRRIGDLGENLGLRDCDIPVRVEAILRSEFAAIAEAARTAGREEAVELVRAAMRVHPESRALVDLYAAMTRHPPAQPATTDRGAEGDRFAERRCKVCGGDKGYMGPQRGCRCGAGK